MLLSRQPLLPELCFSGCEGSTVFGFSTFLLARGHWCHCTVISRKQNDESIAMGFTKWIS